MLFVPVSIAFRSRLKVFRICFEVYLAANFNRKALKDVARSNTKPMPAASK